MAKDSIANTYEEARNQRLNDNKKRFEDLGILKISKSLSDLTSSAKKSQQRISKPKTRNVYESEPRRSTRVRNPVTTYQDEVDIGLPTIRKRSKMSSSWASYLARPVDEVKIASYEERSLAFKCAEKLQSNLQSGNPSFVKSMVRSHVYSCFWLGLPTRFCVEHLGNSTVEMVLENENGLEYEATYIGKRTGLSGGWRAFALDHKLDDGDALVFELIEPSRFKVYIVRAFDCSDEEDDLSEADETKSVTEKTSNEVMKLNDNNNNNNNNNTSDDDDEQPKSSTKSKKNVNSSQPPARRNPARKSKGL